MTIKQVGTFLYLAWGSQLITSESDCTQNLRCGWLA